MAKDKTGGIHRARHHGRPHGEQPAEGGLPAGRARPAPAGGEPSSGGRRDLGRHAARGGEPGRRAVHLAAGAGRRRGGRARRRRPHRRHPAGRRLVRPLDQRAERGEEARGRLRRERRAHARRAGERRPGGRGVAQAGDLGRRREEPCSTRTRTCSTRWATSPPISGRPAAPRWPSWCTTCRATRWCARSPRRSRWASRPGSSRSRCGTRCARARPAGASPSTR